MFEERGFRLNMINIASMIVQAGYTPENKGNLDLIRNSEVSAKTPENFIAVYKELIERLENFEDNVL